MKEKKAFTINGYIGLFIILLMSVVGILLFFIGVARFLVGFSIVGIFLWLLVFLASSGLTVVSPNQAKVIVFFGQYIGTIRESGFFLTIPFAQKINL